MEDILKIVMRDKMLLPPPEDATQDIKDAHEDLMFKAVWYTNCFLAQVAGASTWYRLAVRKTMTISKAKYEGEISIPVNSEAMAILFFENGATREPGRKDNQGNTILGKWYEYFKISNDCAISVKVPRSRQEDPHGKHDGLYTNSKCGSCKYGGWNDEGLERFEYYKREVAQARKLPHAAQVEEAILRRLRKDAYGLEEDVPEEGEEPKKKKPKKQSNASLSFDL